MSQSFCLSGTTSGTFTAHRRRTDLMPTITPGMMARELGSSRSSTPAGTKRSTPGRAVSMSRLDQLSRPRLHANHSPSHTRHLAKGTSKTSQPPNQPLQLQQGGSGPHNGDVVFRQGMSASVSMGHLNRPPSNSANHTNYRSPVKRRSSQLTKRPPRPRPEGKINRPRSRVDHGVVARDTYYIPLTTPTLNNTTTKIDLSSLAWSRFSFFKHDWQSSGLCLGLLHLIWWYSYGLGPNILLVVKCPVITKCFVFSHICTNTSCRRLI